MATVGDGGQVNQTANSYCVPALIAPPTATRHPSGTSCESRNLSCPAHCRRHPPGRRHNKYATHVTFETDTALTRGRFKEPQRHMGEFDTPARTFASGASGVLNMLSRFTPVDTKPATCTRRQPTHIHTHTNTQANDTCFRRQARTPSMYSVCAELTAVLPSSWPSCFETVSTSSSLTRVPSRSCAPTHRNNHHEHYRAKVTIAPSHTQQMHRLNM